MILRWLFGPTEEGPKTATEELRELVARSMPQADAVDAAVVFATAGLLAAVAHADRAYTQSERETVHSALSRMHGLGDGSVEAICALLEEHLDELAHESIQTYTRILYEHVERGARLEVLEVLLELGASDDNLSIEETNLLRRIASGLGLSQEEYLALQHQHRKRLSVLTDK